MCEHVIGFVKENKLIKMHGLSNFKIVFCIVSIFVGVLQSIT